MIGGLSQQEFVSTLHTHLSPTSPIQSEEHLFGRSKQVQLIEQALCAPGRSIFIYGDRGVGKTSLAHTVAHSHQSSAHEPILLACTPQTRFADVMKDAIVALEGPKLQRPGSSHTAKLNIPGGFGFEVGRSRQEEFGQAIEYPSDLNGIILKLIEIASARGNESTVVVIDEFDRISDNNERAQFADFIKQVGDRRVPVRFVFCGVSQSMEALLGAHGSCYRYLDGIELKALSWDARFEIIDAAAAALGISVEQRQRFRIAAISDGFPHYIHRMCEQLFWQLFYDPHTLGTPTMEHYKNAISESVRSIEQHLRQTYDRAVMKEAQGYEEVLWAMADHSDLIRSTESIYASYLDLFRDKDEQLLLRATVVLRLNSLKGASCGRILASSKKGWYQFRENIIRGYVRLRAEEQGVFLAFDYSAASVPSSLVWKPRSARRASIATRRRDWSEPV